MTHTAYGKYIYRSSSKIKPFLVSLKGFPKKQFKTLEEAEKHRDQLVANRLNTQLRLVSQSLGATPKKEDVYTLLSKLFKFFHSNNIPHSLTVGTGNPNEFNIVAPNLVTEDGSEELLFKVMCLLDAPTSYKKCTSRKIWSHEQEFIINVQA